MISLNKTQWLIIFSLFCLSGCINLTPAAPTPIYFVAHPAFDLNEYITDFEERFPGYEIHITYQYNIPDDWPLHFDAALLWHTPYETDLLIDLKSLIKSDPQFEVDDFYPGALATGYETIYTRVDDRLIGIPIGLEFEALVYNSDLVAQTGIDLSSSAWSWQTLLDIARAVNMSHPGPEQTAAFSDDLDRSIVLFNWLHAQSPLYTYIEGQLVPALNAVELEASLSDVCRFLPELSVAVDPQVGPPAGYRPLAYLDEGRAAMTTVLIRDFVAQQQDFVSLAMTAYPQPNLFQEIKADGVLSISRGTQNVQAAWAWVRFLSQNLPPNASADLPARKSVADLARSWDKMDVQVAQWVQTILDGQAYLPDWTERELVNRFRLALIKAMLEACYADVPPGEALVHAQQSARAAVDLWYEYDTEFEPFAVVPQVVSSQDKETLAVMNMNSNVPDYETISAAFAAQHPDWSVQVSDVGPAGQQADVLVWDTNPLDWLVFLYAQQNMAAVSSLSEVNLDADAFDAQALQVVSWHGCVLGVPLSMRPLVLYYHAATFAELGIAPPASDWTVADVLAAAAQIRAANPKLIGYAPLSGSEVRFVLEQQGISLFEPDRLTPQFVSSLVIEALEWLGSLQASGTILAPTTSASVMQLPVGFFGIQHYRGEPMDAVAIVPRAGVRWPIQVTFAGVVRGSQHANIAWEWAALAHQFPPASDALPANRTLLDGWETQAASNRDLRAAYLTALKRGQNLPGRDDAAMVQDVALWWFETALRQTGVGLEAALLQAQDKAAQFAACMSAAAGVEPSTLGKCVRETDQAHPLAQMVP